MWRGSGLTVHKEKQHVKSLMKAPKKDHFLSKFKECASDQAKMYKVAEQILHHKNPASLHKYDDLQNLVNDFSQFFTAKIFQNKRLVG